MSHTADKEFQQRMQRIETLVQQVEQFSDPGARDTTREIVQSLLELHGAGLATMLTLAAEAKEAGPPLVDAFVADGLVASLFLLHGLHPLDIETRIRAALVRIRPHLHAHNGEVELLGLSEGIVRLRLQGGSEMLKRHIEEAVYEAAPDATFIEIEGVPEVGTNGRISLPLRSAGPMN